MPNDKVQDVESERPQQPAAATIELPREITGPRNDRADQAADSKDTNGKSNSDGQGSTAAYLWKSLSGAGNQVVEAAKKSLPDLSIIGLGDPSAAEKAQAEKEDRAVKSSAEAGKKNGDQAINRYFEFRDSKQTGANKNTEAAKDASALANHEDANKEKPLESLAVAGKDRPYEAKYNDKNELIQLKSPSGMTFNRVSPENENGFAYWQAKNEKGQVVNYGSNSDKFVGKLALDKEGAHVMIGHDKRNPRNDSKWAGSLVETRADGAESFSSVTSANGKATGIETRLTQKDGTVVTARALYDKDGRLNATGDVTVSSKDGDSKYVVKDGEITARDTNLIAKKEAEETARNLDANSKLNNLRRASVTTLRDGSLHVDIHNARATFQNSVNPGTVINGTRIDGSTVGNHVVMNAKYKNGAIEMRVDGITGHGARRGPLGRWRSGSGDVDAIKIEPGRMHSHTERGWTSTPQHLMTDKARGSVDAQNIQQAGEIIKTIAENSKNLQVEKVAAREFKVSVKPSEQLKQQMNEKGLLKFDGDLNMKFSYDEKGMKMTDIQGIKAFGMNITEIRSQPGKAGKMDYKATYVNPANGEKGNYSISEDQIKKMTKSFGR